MPDPSTKLVTAPPRAAAAPRASRATGSSKKKTAAAAPTTRSKKVAKSAAKKKSVAKRKTATRLRARSTPPLGETVVAAVRRDLEALSHLSDEGKSLATGALAMSAIALAKSIDHDRTSPTARSMCARALTETLEKLRGMVPDESQEGDGIDDLAERRQQRRAGSAKA